MRLFSKIKKYLLIVICLLPLLALFIWAADINWPKNWRKINPKNLILIKKEITPLPWLKTSGRYIVNEKNEPVILRGVNIVGLNWGHKDWFPKAIETAINQWGANVIRARVYQDKYLTDPESFFEEIEKFIINPARQNNTYVILNPWINQNDSLPDENTEKMWRDIAQRYQNNPNIIYDILAEPHDVKPSQVWQANKKLISVIRAVHPKSLIMVTGIAWGREINSYLDNPLPYENIVYRTNPYNKIGEFQAIFGQIVYHYPVFIGEFGADAYPPMSREAVSALLELADKLSLGWTAWHFHSIGCPCLLSDFKSYQVSLYGEIVKKALKKPISLYDGQPISPPKEKLFIYSDYLENNFRDLSWDATVNLVYQKEVFIGEKAIKVTIDKGFGALYLSNYTTIDPQKFSYFHFAIKGDNLANYKLGFVDENDQSLPEASLTSLSPNNNWHIIKIPLTKINPQQKKISGLVIKDSTNASSVFYLDSCYFE